MSDEPARQLRATLDRAAVLRQFLADLGAGDEAMLRDGSPTWVN